jgi:hypothetical protein
MFKSHVLNTNGKVHLVKGLLGNKDINKKCILDIYEIHCKRMLLYGAEIWTTTTNLSHGNDIF